MDATLVPHVFTFLLGAALLALTALAPVRGRLRRHNAYVGWAMSAAALWAASDGLAACLATPSIIVPSTSGSAPLTASLPWLCGVRYLSVAMLPVAWYAVAASHASDGKRPSISSLTRLSLVPVVTAILAGTNPLHELVWRPTIAAGVPGFWYGVHAAYGGALWVAGCAALLRNATDARRATRRSIWGIAGIGLIIALASTMGPGLVGAWGAVAVMLALAASGALLLWLVSDGGRRRSGLGQNELSGWQEQPLVALDRQDRVLDANVPALLLLAEHGVWDAVGCRVDELLAGPLRSLCVRRSGGAMAVAMDGAAARGPVQAPAR